MTSTAGFTKGPWTVEPHCDGTLDNDHVCRIGHINSPGRDMGNVATTWNDPELANARLIAAAPDLYEALRHAERLLTEMHIATNGDDDPTELRGVYPSIWKSIDQMRAALSKATKP